ncbi:MAG: hypothetical protein M0Z31_09500 [Clostridia bacterium]|nr:hypothetical protein [Clostridia bacterium]
MSNKVLVSCFQCTGMVKCYGQTNSDLIEVDRQVARNNAAKCTKLERGLPTEVVRVLDRERGMSRKKAQKLVEQGEATWLEHNLVELYK